LPFGLPPFADLTDDHYLPAFEAAMAEHLTEVDAIATDPEPPTFDNTVAALERAGRTLQRVSAAFFAGVASHATDAVRAIETEISPRLAAHRDTVMMNRALYERVRRIEGGDAEEAYLLERYRLDFQRAGAELSDADQARLRELNQELSTLSTAFTQTLLDAATSEALVVDDPARFDGLDPTTIDGLATPAGDGAGPTWRLPLLNFTSQPALAELTDRQTRRRLYEQSVNRAASNRARVVRMVGLRVERARILGFPTHAAYAVADQTAKTVEAVEDLLAQLSGPAVRNAEREGAALSEEAGFTIEAWDWPFYAEAERRDRYAFDQGDMRPYFELDRVYADGVFQTATDLYGLTFTARPDLAAYHPDVRVFEVGDTAGETDPATGKALGLFLLDPYARPTKRGGAWMASLARQSSLLGEAPVVVNNLNITKPASGPTLLSLDEVKTAFHEFGHALHALLSDVRFPRVSGTAVPRDFVEFPSQVNEMWMTWPEVLARYARHHETGEPMPRELVDKLEAAERFNQGFATLEYLQAAVLDWAWHTLGGETDPDCDSFDPGTFDVDAFEAAALAAGGVDFPLVTPRYRSAYFAHIFGGGYSAGYYSYIWSEVLDADTVEWFRENGGLTRENGERFRRTVLARGGSGDPMEAFRALRGRDPRIEPLLERRGLT
jgi:peptidyl-dipeptidase Dcp